MCDYLTKFNIFRNLHLVHCFLNRELGVALWEGNLFLLGSRCNGTHEPSNFAKPFALGGIAARAAAEAPRAGGSSTAAGSTFD